MFTIRLLNIMLQLFTEYLTNFSAVSTKQGARKLSKVLEENINRMRDEFAEGHTINNFIRMKLLSVIH